MFDLSVIKALLFLGCVLYLLHLLNLSLNRYSVGATAGKTGRVMLRMLSSEGLYMLLVLDS